MNREIQRTVERAMGTNENERLRMAANITDQAALNFVSELNAVHPTLGLWAAERWNCGMSLREIKTHLRRAADFAGR